VPEEEQFASIKATVVETSEPTFKPPPLVEPPEDGPFPPDAPPIDTGQAVKRIFAVLEPLEQEQTTIWPPDYLDYYNTILPPYLPEYEPLPEYEAPPKELIINIETTGAKPWESRLICIGVLDPNSLSPEAMNFIQEKEEDTLNEFLEWLNTTEYSVLVGYNVSFDYRFLYALMQKYRKSVPRWKEMELYDLMQQQKQVKAEFVFGYNPAGKLEEWATYLLGTKPYAEQKQLYRWWKEKDVDEIVNFNSDKLMKAYYLWVLDKVVSAAIPGSEVLARPAAPATATPTGMPAGASPQGEETIKVKCPNCLQEQEMQKTAKVINCFVCGTPIPNPAL